MVINDAAVATFWKTCCEDHAIAESAYRHVGPFSDPGLAPYQEMLLRLVKDGGKRATARVDIEFEKYGIPRRGPGDLWLVTDTTGDPACLIRITDVQAWPFLDVPLGFARREGEGDNTLEYWRKVHKDYFVLQCEQWDVEWRDDHLVCCEGFDLVTMA